jgi:hypothetical protein
VFLMRQAALQSVPRELLSAARMDGASEWRVFWSVVLPLLRPALGTLALITFIASWNNFMAPLVVMRAVENYTLPLALRAMQSPNNTEWGALMLGSALALLPLLVVYLFSARKLVAGMAAGAVKADSLRSRCPVSSHEALRPHNSTPPTSRRPSRPTSSGAPRPPPRRSRAAFEDGKGASIWDSFCRQPGRINDGSNIDVACDHYHRYREDVGLMKGWAWTATASPSPGRACSRRGRAPGTRPVSRSTTACSTNCWPPGIQPHATLYHWDLPQALHDGMGAGCRATSCRASPTTPPRSHAASATAGQHRDAQRALVRRHAGLRDRAVRARPHQPRRGLQVAHHLMLAHGEAIRAMRAHTRPAWASCSTTRPPTRPSRATRTARPRRSTTA